MTANFKTNFTGIMCITCVIMIMSSRNVYTNTCNVRESHIVETVNSSLVSVSVETVKIQKVIMNVFVKLFKRQHICFNKNNNNDISRITYRLFCYLVNYENTF